MIMDSNFQPTVVAVTGAAGYIGSRLLDFLLARPEVSKVIAIDSRLIPISHKKLIRAQIDINCSLESLLLAHQVDTLVHLAFIIRQQRNRVYSQQVNVGGTHNILRSAANTGVKKIIYFSSATVYGALPSNPEFLTENNVTRPPFNFHYAWDKREAEIALESYSSKFQKPVISILRGSIVMGPSAYNSITDALSKPFLVGIKGNNPQIQFTHDKDLVRIIWQFVSESHSGTFNIAGPGSLSWSQLAEISGKKIIWLSPRIAYWIVDALWKVKMQKESTSSGLDYIRWPWVVSTKKLETELKYKFLYTSAQAFKEYVSSIS